jgi:hypothetical protein
MSPNSDNHHSSTKTTWSLASVEGPDDDFGESWSSNKGPGNPLRVPEFLGELSPWTGEPSEMSAFRVSDKVLFGGGPHPGK